MTRFLRVGAAFAFAAALISSYGISAHAAATAESQRTIAKAPADAGSSDPFLWLEDVHGARATQWVSDQNTKTLGVFEKDPHYAGLYSDALMIAQAKDRIPMPSFIGGQIYNFWQDETHVRGIWRTTTQSDFANASPNWTTVLDLDALAKREHANWVMEGETCEWPAEQRCLVNLSDGGEDAVTIREFDLKSRRFVTGGFVLPHGKQNVAWVNRNTLLVSRAWEPGQLTASGYPYVVKRVTRGKALSSAVEIFRGTKTDVSVDPFALQDGNGNTAIVIRRGVSFFVSEYYLQTPKGLRKLNVPGKTEIDGMLRGRLLMKLNEDWNAIPQGSLVAVDLQAAMADPSHLKPTIVYLAQSRDSLEGIAVTRSQLILAMYHNVKGRAAVYTPVGPNGWNVRPIDLPDNSSIDIIDSDLRSENVYVMSTSFLSPSTLYLANANTASVTAVKAISPKFDASKDAVEQYEATSKDGTKVPYFIVHPKTMALDGSNPTILYAYGGFQVSMTPSYSAMLGKLWLERGGVYVLANIRGGGEFGPAWHEAGLKTNRQRIYDDFAAVGQDLMARKVTSPRRLGIEGGSNGGLLMGVEFTQHPEMWNAVDIQVPLLDMLRFEQIAAGASWVGEYGSVSIPEQRAFLASISPYNNLKAGTAYPQALIWTTTKDDRVGPQHARKFAAKLASMDVPYYFYEVTEGGHGAGANLKEKAHTSALEYTYFTRKLMDP